jgi:hypothetical protein
MKANTLTFLFSAAEPQLRALLYKYIEDGHDSILDVYIEELQGGKAEPKVPGAIPLRAPEGMLNYSFSGGKCYMTERTFKFLEDVARSGNKVQTIKEHRNITGFGLKESKDWVEHHFEDLIRAARPDRY